MSIGSSGSVLVGSRSSWLCEVNCVQRPHIQWLDKNGVPVSSSGPSVWAEKIIINETMTHLRLHINPVRSSHAGTYTCTSSVVFPPSTKRGTLDLIVKCKLVQGWWKQIYFGWANMTHHLIWKYMLVLMVKWFL